MQKYSVCQKHNKSKLKQFILVCLKLNATIPILLCSDNTLKGRCLSSVNVIFLKRKQIVTQCLFRVIVGPFFCAASSGPGSLDNNCTSNHIIHSPVVLEEQKSDEGWEEEGNGKVLIQGSNSRSEEGDRNSTVM